MTVLSDIRLGSSLGFYFQFGDDLITTMDAVTGCGFDTPNTWNSTSTNLILNEAMFLPIIVPVTFPVVRLFMHGADADGNLDIGLYNTSGTRLVSTGSTANAASIISPSISTTTINPGQYYLAWSSDNNTTQDVYGMSTTDKRTCFGIGVKKMASAFPLPSTATFADPDASMELPMIGISKRETI